MCGVARYAACPRVRGPAADRDRRTQVDRRAARDTWVARPNRRPEPTRCAVPQRLQNSARRCAQHTWTVGVTVGGNGWQRGHGAGSALLPQPRAAPPRPTGVDRGSLQPAAAPGPSATTGARRPSAPAGLERVYRPPCCGVSCRRPPAATGAARRSATFSNGFLESVLYVG